jgi:hypothetical protein
MPDEPPWWQILVAQIVYGGPLQTAADDALLNQLVDTLFSGRVFHEPVERYYRAAVEALRSGEELRMHDHQDEDAVRDILARMVVALDRRRPWHEPRYRSLWPDGVWGELRDTVPIGTVPMSVRDIEKHLHLPFTIAGHMLRHPEEVIAVRLRTGQVVALRAATAHDDSVELYSAANPAVTRGAFRDFTGLEVHSI